MIRNPKLLPGPSVRSFIGEGSGRLNLHGILFPVAASHSPVEAADRFQALTGNIPAQVSRALVSERENACSRFERIFPRLTSNSARSGWIVVPSGREIETRTPKSKFQRRVIAVMPRASAFRPCRTATAGTGLEHLGLQPLAEAGREVPGCDGLCHVCLPDPRKHHAGFLRKQGPPGGGTGL